jgi:hypothetical protein
MKLPTIACAQPVGWRDSLNTRQMQEQPLRQGAGEGLVQRDVGQHFTEGDAADLNFDGSSQPLARPSVL